MNKLIYLFLLLKLLSILRGQVGRGENSSSSRRGWSNNRLVNVVSDKQKQVVELRSSEQHWQNTSRHSHLDRIDISCLKISSKVDLNIQWLFCKWTGMLVGSSIHRECSTMGHAASKLNNGISLKSVLFEYRMVI